MTTCTFVISSVNQHLHTHIYTHGIRKQRQIVDGKSTDMKIYYKLWFVEWKINIYDTLAPHFIVVSSVINGTQCCI